MSMEFLAVIEDDPDVHLLIESIFSMDSRFSAANAAETADEALESARKTEPGIIVLDYGLAGSLTGLDAAPPQRASSTREDHPVHSPRRAPHPCYS
ncbi:MAG: hypothetical protein ABI903_13510 [Actinomycetota bacterium]